MENPFEIIIQKLDKIESMLMGVHQPTNNLKTDKQTGEEILDLNMVSELLHISKATLYGKTAKREIPHYKLGKKLYFKKSEIIEWMSIHKQKTIKEIEDEASNYIIRRKSKKYY